MAKVTTVELEGKTFFVALSWGRLKKTMRAMDKLDVEGDAIEVLELIERTLLSITKRIEGWNDDGGNPITSFEQEIVVDEETMPAIDDLLPGYIMTLWGRITSAGEDVTDQETTIPLADSSEPELDSLPKDGPEE